MCLLYFAAAYYRSSAREVKRHEAILRSHVFSRFNEALSGTSTIRAYNVGEHYRRELERLIDEMDTCYFMTFSNQCWLSTRLDIVGNTLALITALVVVTNHLKTNPSLSAVILSYVLQVTNMMQFIVKQLAQVENSMNSTERLVYYSNKLPSEATPDPDTLIKPAPSWPERGEIKFEGVQMRYREGLPLVLKGLDLHVRGGERVGIVGRTGAGKSSIMSCLFRMIELSSGQIEVDGNDVSKMDLYDLRSRLSIIPQGKSMEVFRPPSRV
jgi:ATP-binding cassette subfamily C (CFTR/MRP) protein 1